MRSEDLEEFLRFLASTSGVEDPVAIGHRFEAAIRRYSLGLFTLVLVERTPSEQCSISGLWDLPAAWIDHYERSGYGAIDPLIGACRSASRPFNWFSLLARPGLDDRQRRVFDEAAEFGIGLGLTLPIRRSRDAFTMISVTTDYALDPTADAIRLHAPFLHLLGLALHDRATHLVTGRRVQLDPESRESTETHDAAPPAAPVMPLLSRSQRDCLAWICTGCSLWDVADHVGLTADEAFKQIEVARIKLSASSPEHAIVRALDLGLIHP